jgi:hypothetical protein
MEAANGRRITSNFENTQHVEIAHDPKDPIQKLVFR